MMGRAENGLASLIAAAMMCACTSAPATRAAITPPPGAAAENLQVLPRDISRDALIATMGGFTRALGVNCAYCHVARNGTRVEDADFPLDEKETKQVARAMITMVREINARHLPATGRTVSARHQVTCETCHRGLARPRTLEAELLDRYETAGIDSAVALFRDLRSRYLDRGAYNFSDVSLPTAAGRIAATPANRADALALMRLNLEFHPQSWFTYQQMGQIQVAMGDTTSAIASYERGLAINPNRPFLRQLLEAIQRRP